MDKSIAVIGCGYWGENLVRNFARLGVLHTICDTSSSLVAKLASQYPAASVGTDYHEVLSNREVRGIVIATPAPLHYTMAKEALLNGKDVFVEKPFTTSRAAAEELVAISSQKGQILMVGHLLLYHPAVQKLKKYIQAGELGEIYYLYSTRVNLGQVRRDENALWRLVPHDLATFIYLLDECPQVVAAQGSSYLQPNFIDVVFVTLKFQRVLAHVHASWLDPHKIRQLTIVGSKKMAIFDDMAAVNKLQIHDKRVVSDTQVLASGETILPKLDLNEPLELECREFIECLKARKQPRSDARMGLEVTKILAAAQKSLQRGGQPVSIPGG